MSRQAPTNGNYGGSDRRQSSAVSSSGYGQSNTLQRKQTLRQVEAAAGMAGPDGRSAAGARLGSQFHGSPAPSLSSQHSVPNPHRQSYQLSDRPVSAAPAVNGGGQGQGSRIASQQPQQQQQQQQQGIQMKQKPSTFAEVCFEFRLARRSRADLTRTLFSSRHPRWASLPPKPKRTSVKSCRFRYATSRDDIPLYIARRRRAASTTSSYPPLLSELITSSISDPSDMALG